MKASARKSPSPWTVLRGHSAEVQCLEFCDEEHMATGDSDGLIKIWNLEIRRPISEARVAGAQEGVLSLQVLSSEDGEMQLISAGRDGSIQRHAVTKGYQLVRSGNAVVSPGVYGFCRPHAVNLLQAVQPTHSHNDVSNSNGTGTESSPPHCIPGASNQQQTCDCPGQTPTARNQSHDASAATQIEQPSRHRTIVAGPGHDPGETFLWDLSHTPTYSQHPPYGPIPSMVLSPPDISNAPSLVTVENDGSVNGERSVGDGHEKPLVPHKVGMVMALQFFTAPSSEQCEGKEGVHGSTTQADVTDVGLREQGVHACSSSEPYEGGSRGATTQPASHLSQQQQQQKSAGMHGHQACLVVGYESGTLAVWRPFLTSSGPSKQQTVHHQKHQEPVGMVVRAHMEPIMCVAVSPDGAKIVTGAADDHVCVWKICQHRNDQSTDVRTEDSEAPSAAKQLEASADSHAVSIKPKGGLSGLSGVFASKSRSASDAPQNKCLEHMVQVELKCVAKHHLIKAGISHAAWRQDGRLFCTAGWDGKVRIFSGKKHYKPLAILQYHTKEVTCAVWCPFLARQHPPDDADEYSQQIVQGQDESHQRQQAMTELDLLASSSRDGNVALWNLYPKHA